MFFFIFSTTIYFLLLCNMYVIIFSTSQVFLLGHHEIRQNIFTNAKDFLITWKSWYEPTYKPSFILDCICIWKINKECEIQKYFSHTLPYFFIFPLCVLLISGKDQRSQDMNHLLCWRSLSKWNRRRRNAPFLRKRKTETQSSSSR